jgi:hypothetical protein
MTNPADKSNITDSRPMRVAVIFFGVARGVSVTIESLKNNLYAANPEAEFYTIASLNLVESISNPRTGEDGISINPADAFLLNADVYTLARQNDDSIAEAFAAARQNRDYFENEWVSVKNALHQLASLRRAWSLVSDTLPGGVDYFLFVRPDLIYLDQFKLSDIVRGFHGRGNIALPSWHSWGGFNDRFALADATAARHYAERLSLVPEYCAKTVFHPESFLGYALEKGRCGVCALPVKANRVRADGVIKEEDFSESISEISLDPRRFHIQSGQICFDEDQWRWNRSVKRRLSWLSSKIN